MTKPHLHLRTALVASLALGVSGFASLAAAAPPPTAPPRTDPAAPSPNLPTTPNPTPSPTPADPTPPTGSMPQLNKGRAPNSGGVGKMTSAPSDPGSTAGILNERDVPGRELSVKDANAAQKALQELHRVNTLEIALGALARDKATSDPIKDYARELVESHQASDRKLAGYAASHGFTLTTSTSVSQATARDTLPAGTDTAIPVDPKVAPGAAMPSGERPAGSNRPGGAGTGTGRPGSGTVAGTETSPATTGTLPPPASTPGAATNAAAERAVASDANPTEELDAEGRRILAKLQKLEGDKFDRQFLTTMVTGHTKALNKIKSFEKQQKNAEISALLSDARTMVEHHLERAKTLLRGGSVDAGGAQRTLGAL